MDGVIPSGKKVINNRERKLSIIVLCTAVFVDSIIVRLASEKYNIKIPLLV
jgi:hypothetical protein